MLLFRRSREPKGFSKHAALVRLTMRNNQVHELWRKEEYKRAFGVAQHDKCGYCETFAFNHPPAVEHFAPKGNVQALVREGVEASGLYHVRDRETPEISATGYHWLALSWTNWLLACERCNTGWKRSLFPLREHIRSGFLTAVENAHRLGGIAFAAAFIAGSAPRPPHHRRRFTPLLLNPFGPEDPVDHLDFNELGEIAPRDGSDHGRETIRTCGLHRESLRRARQLIAADTYRHVARLTCALADQDFEKARMAAEDLLSLGDARRAHAGMVRCIVLSQLSLRWAKLEILAKRLQLCGAEARRCLTY